MSVVPLTLTISLCLVFTFIVFFLRQHARSAISSAERDSLLPLAEETPHLTEPKHLKSESDHDHAAALAADGAECGCRSGRHDACAGCLKRPAVHT
jgi:hypothetical protein